MKIKNIFWVCQFYTFLLFLIVNNSLYAQNDTLYPKYYGDITNLKGEYNGKYIKYEDFVGYTHIDFIQNKKRDALQKEIDPNGNLVIEYFLKNEKVVWWKYYNEDGSLFSSMEFKNGEPWIGKFPFEIESISVDLVSAYAFREIEEEFQVAIFENGKMVATEDYFSATKPKTQFINDGYSLITYDYRGKELGNANYKKPYSSLNNNPINGNLFSFLNHSVSEKRTYEDGNHVSSIFYHNNSNKIWKKEYYEKEEVYKTEAFYINGNPKYINIYSNNKMEQTNFTPEGAKNSYTCDIEKERFAGLMIRNQINKDGVFYKEDMETYIVALEIEDQFLITDVIHYSNNTIKKEEQYLTDTLLLYSIDYNGKSKYYNPQTKKYVTAILQNEKPIDGTVISYMKRDESIEEYKNIYELTTYKNGLKDGPYFYYWVDGIEKEEHYKEGLKNGFCKYYFKGENESEIYYKNDYPTDTFLYIFWRFKSVL